MGLTRGQIDPSLSPSLAYNDSHDGSYVLSGIVRGDNAEIGVDLMQLPLEDPKVIQEGISDQVHISPFSRSCPFYLRTTLLSPSKWFFSPEYLLIRPTLIPWSQLLHSERQVLAVNLSKEERARRITTFWTFKEGYTKAIGEGIGFGLERIKVDMDDDGQVQVVSVDGRDIKEDGWKWESGWIGANNKYGWVAIWRGDEDSSGDVELISWNCFAKPFLDSVSISAPP